MESVKNPESLRFRLNVVEEFEGLGACRRLPKSMITDWMIDSLLREPSNDLNSYKNYLMFLENLQPTLNV